MKNLITYLKALWSWGLDSQSSDVSLDCRLTVGSPSGLDAKWKQNPFMRFAVVLTLIFTIGSGNAWGTVLFHETFGNNAESARAWDNTYSVKSGVSAVYSGITGYTVSNCKQGKNTTGSTQSGLNQTTQGTDAYIIIGPLSVASYSSLGVTYQWKAGSIKGTYTTKLYYATSSGGSYTEVSGTGTGATTFVERSYSLPVAAQVSTLYLKIVWNTSNTQAIIDEVELTGTAAVSCDKKVTIVKGTPETGGSFSLDKTGEQNCCDALTVTVSSIVAPSGKKFSAITQSGIASGVTIDQSAKTVTYAANSSGSSTINVTFESKGCTDHAGTNVTSGSTTSTKYGPVATYYKHSTRQILYTKTDLDLAAGKKGTIKSIYFDAATDLTARNITIYMANTSLTALSTSNYVSYGDFTQVFTSSSWACSTGWNEIELTTPFEYNGIGNLVVLIDDNSGFYKTSETFNCHTASTTTGAQIWKGSDDTNENPSSTTWSSYEAINTRPSTKFCIQEADMTPATVTLMDNSATLTEASAGAGVTLPSRTGCTDYTFAGWTKTWTEEQDEWTTTAPTIIPAGSYTPSANENLYPVYTKTEGGGTTETTVTETFTNQTSNSSVTDWKQALTWDASESNASIEWTTYYGKIANGYTEIRTYSDGVMGYLWTSEPITGLKKVKFKGWRVTESDAANMVVSYSTDNDTWYELGTHAATSDNSTFSDEFEITSSDPSSAYYLSIDLSDATCPSSSNKKYRIDDIVITTETGGGSTTSYISVSGCCTDPELSYGTAPMTKTYGEGVFTNTLTNSHSVGVTYDSSDKTVATVDSEGEVTILKAGSTTITASSAAQTVAAVSYCADEASYTLTVNKANISPTLSYTPNSVAVGESTSAPTVGGNPGSGGVTYAITSASPLGCATINTSTGVVTGAAVGSVTVTATVAATANYNGGSATANVTIHAASYFPNGKTIFIQAESSSAWSDANYDCVKAWFHTAGGSETAQTTYWLFDATGGDSGKKLFAAIVPATGDLPYLDIQRFTHDCSDWRNKNGGCSYSDANGSNTIRSTGNTDTYDAQDDYIRWNATGVTMNLMSSDAWLTPVASMTDQGSGVWSGTYEYTPSNTSTEYVIATNYNGNIGNTGSNSNATLSGMVVGSTYDVTATLDIKDHSLEMSKTFVEGTVHFNLQGHGSAISDLTNVTAGSKISAPSPAPSATGYDFGGWYKEPACTNAWNFGSDVVNETMTLYAKWTAHEYTITKTLTNVTSSPVIPSTYTYTGAAAGLNYTISPSDGYRLPTEITVSGTTYTWNPATGALALTGTIASNVTITIVAVQTHTVDWYVGGSAVGNKLGDDGQTTVVDHGGKIEDFPATTPDGSACDKEFVGWTNTTSYTHGTSLLFNDVAGSPTINADANFYAVFAEVNVATGYTYIGDEGMLEAGETYIFVSSKSTGSAYALKSSDLPQNNTSGVKGTAVSVTVATGIKVSAENSDLEFTCSTHTEDEMDVLVLGSSANTLRINGNGIGYGDARAYYDNTGLYGWNNKGDTYYDVYYNSTSTKFEASSSASGRVYAYKKGGTTYTGHTITCADCGTSVTPTYTAAPTGGTVSVTKSATPVASGSTVKTCTAVDLTVTITPATHYTLTGFTATGLTTGTATISPAVNTVVPTASAQTFTVTVSAGATGTLNLTPTFTPETPLTITLSTNGKGTYSDPAEWPIYAGESFTLPNVTPNDPSCATFVGWIQGTTFPGDGSTHDAPVTISDGSSSGALSVNTTYTAVFYETETSETDAYVKLTSAPVNWANDHYLIVYEDGGVAFDGSLSTLDASSNTVAVSISSGAIAATSALAASEWKIALISGSNYSIQSASGKYIGNASNSNALTTSAEALANTLSISSGDFGVVSSGGAYLRYNSTSGQERFRYYKSSSYTSQQAIQLYKLGTAVVETQTYTTNPACTPKYRVTVASVAGGSPNADPKFNPEDTEVTLTANPAAGYSFTGWTITHTEGGAAASVTYTTGSASTETAVFEMPAYDVTVTASYAKIYVTSVVAKEGETTLNTSDHKLNINTGANKTVTVVVTPSDAFDHSWTATVSAGSTYASITNTTAEGFRVNGLAEGDATIVVTAPNDDGTDRTATFTVHVTDVLPEEIILKRDGSETPINALTIYLDQYAKINVSYSPTPTDKAFTFSSADATSVSSRAHAPASGYETLHGLKVTSSPVNCTFTSAATGSVTKVLAVTVLPCPADQFVDYIHGNATVTRAAQVSADHWSINTSITTPTLSDAAESSSADCETGHYHLIGWLPQSIAEALFAAGTPITSATEGLVAAGAEVEASGITWYAIWAKKE